MYNVRMIATDRHITPPREECHRDSPPTLPLDPSKEGVSRMEDALVQVVELGEQGGTEDNAAIGATGRSETDKEGRVSQCASNIVSVHVLRL
jgi:hypothetical protein